MDSTHKSSAPVWLWFVLGVVFVVIIGGFIYTRKTEGPRPNLPIYAEVPQFSLTNQHGVVINNEALKGTVWISDVIFTRCPVQCLKLTAQMKKFQSALPESRFVSLTADPQYDTPSVLKRYADDHGAISGRWDFLTGNRDDVFRLAVNGFKFAVVEKKEDQKEFPDDLFIHSLNFALVDKQGRIRGWFDGSDAEAMTNIVRAAKYLQKRE